MRLGWFFEPPCLNVAAAVQANIGGGINAAIQGNIANVVNIGGKFGPAYPLNRPTVGPWLAYNERVIITKSCRKLF
jgi:hypothetical protein